MSRKRRTDIWHVPKRANLYQMIGAVNIIKNLDINGRTWPQTRKFFDQKFAMWGFTNRGRSLSKNASETFEALMKYLGLIIINEGRIYLTNCGYKLTEEYSINEPSIKKRRLNITIQQIGKISSRIIAIQLLKLRLTNPTISQYCTEIKLFPFRETLNLLLDDEIEYLDQDEIGYILFNMQNKNQSQDVKKKILEFRALSVLQRTRVISSYKKTPEGNLTLVQAPTTTYWRQLCENTGLCFSSGKTLRIKKDKKDEVRELLSKYSESIFDFGNDEVLWNEYYGNCKITSPPINAKIQFEGEIDGRILVIKKDHKVRLRSIEKNEIDVIVFPDIKYNFEVIDIVTEKTINSDSHTFIENNNLFQIKLGRISITNVHNYDKKILELINSDNYDDFYKKLIHIVSKKTGTNFEDKAYIPSLRGGRLEYLFFKVLEQIQKSGVISNLVWNGRVDEFGLARPALGTQNGLPDITFKCENLQFLLELTTIKSATSQWRAEGMSVPFHIRNFVREEKISKVFGIFCAPITHAKLHESLKSNRFPEHYDIAYITIEKLLQILQNQGLKKSLLGLFS